MFSSLNDSKNCKTFEGLQPKDHCFLNELHILAHAMFQQCYVLHTLFSICNNILPIIRLKDGTQFLLIMRIRKN